MGRNSRPATLQELLAWLTAAPPGTSLEAAAMHDLLEPFVEAPSPPPTTQPVEPTWRERLWTVPAQTRIGVKELAEAVARPVSWVYHHTSRNGHGAGLPYRRLGGELVFVVGEIRAWLERQEAASP